MVDVGVREADDGWDYWTRVYEDPRLRHQLAAQNQKGPTVRQMLQSEELCQGDLLFMNVPRLGNSQQAVVRQLINDEMGRIVPLLDVAITCRRWRVRFYRLEDANDVQGKLDGFRFRHKPLLVRHAAKPEPLIKRSPAVPGKQNECGGDGATLPAAPKIVDPSFTPVEMSEFEQFKEELCLVLARYPHGIHHLKLLEEVHSLRRRGVVAAALELWPLGLLRIFGPQIRLTGTYASLGEQGAHRLLLGKALQEGHSAVPRDDWEPMAVCNVRTEHHLISAATALLTRFGPQHCKVDLPIRLFAKALPGQWPSGSVALCEYMSGLSPSLLLFDDILYLATSVGHRRALLDRLNPPDTKQRLPWSPALHPSPSSTPASEEPHDTPHLIIFDGVDVFTYYSFN
ncbi:unnamed protein product, partial [Mesorhabditis spiculigera]